MLGERGHECAVSRNGTSSDTAGFSSACKSCGTYSLGAIAVIALSAADLRPWLVATSELGQEVPPIARQDLERATADMERYAQCNSMRGSVANELTSAGRDCLLAAMPKIQTPYIAIASAQTASEWLFAHPEDGEVRAAAMDAITHSRGTLIREKPWSDKISKATETRDSSLLLRVVHGRQGSDDIFHSMADLLDRAELTLTAPDVVRRQSAWRLQAMRE